MWPEVMAVKLKYNDMRATAASGSQVTQQFRLNSVFDPDYTNTGHQPVGFDQLAALYVRYRVVAVEAKVRVQDQTSGGSCLVAMAPVENNALSTTAEGVAELRNAVSTTTQFGGPPANLRARWHIGELLGYSDASVLSMTTMDAPVTSNPTYMQYLLIMCETTGATDTVEIECELVYYVRFEIPISFTTSLAKHRFAMLRERPVSDVSNVSGAACGGAKSTTPAQLATTQLQKVRQMLDGL
jgi:hypothetical protein